MYTCRCLGEKVVTLLSLFRNLSDTILLIGQKNTHEDNDFVKNGGLDIREFKGATYWKQGCGKGGAGGRSPPF